eukprot:3139788-Amphidinium_carterae.1
MAVRTACDIPTCHLATLRHWTLVRKISLCHGKGLLCRSCDCANLWKCACCLARLFQASRYAEVRYSRVHERTRSKTMGYAGFDVQNTWQRI